MQPIENMDELPSLQELAAKSGLTPQQIDSKAFRFCESVMVDEQISVSKSVREAVEHLRETALSAQTSINKTLYQVNSARMDLEKSIRRAEESDEKMARTKKELEKACDGISKLEIQDQAAIDGVLVFRETIQAVRDVFGESAMSEAVICSAIEAGSYGMWRSIMGPKDNIMARSRYDNR